MYRTIEFFSEDGKDLKDILKECINDYFLQNKNLFHDDLQNQKNSNIMDSTNFCEILSLKGGKNV